MNDAFEQRGLFHGSPAGGVEKLNLCEPIGQESTPEDAPRKPKALLSAVEFGLFTALSEGRDQ